MQSLTGLMLDGTRIILEAVNVPLQTLVLCF